MSWHSLDTSDTDLGSTEPFLLPDGLVFQIGKQGIGYLLSGSGLGGTAAAAAYEGSVCAGSYGGAIYSGGVIYVACSDGLRALTLSSAGPSFLAVAGWQVTSGANGPPIMSGGLVWVTDWNHATLYGMNPQTGQPVVTQSTPPMEHFATPSASDSKLFLATGRTVEAYTIANPAPTASPAAPPLASAVARAQCVLKLLSPRVKVHHPMRRKHHRHAPPVFATVALTARCDQAVSVGVSGTVTQHLSKRGKHGAPPRTRRFHVATVRAALRPGVSRTLQIRLNPALLRALEQRVRTSGVFTLTTTTAAGVTRVVARGGLRR